MEAAHESFVWSLSWHPLGHFLVSGSNDTTRCLLLTSLYCVERLHYKSDRLTVMLFYWLLLCLKQVE